LNKKKVKVNGLKLKLKIVLPRYQFPPLMLKE